jgi:plastocyanin
MAGSFSRPNLLPIGVLVATLAGCGGGGTRSSAAEPTTLAAQPVAQSQRIEYAATDPGTVRITIKDFKFSPSPLQVKVGQKITVTNMDSTVHTVKAADKSFNSGNLAKGKSYTFTATKAGKHPYICDIHQYMTGEIDIS